MSGDVCSAVATIQRMVQTDAPPMSDADRAHVGIFLRALDHVFAADPAIAVRLRLAWNGDGCA